MTTNELYDIDGTNVTDIVYDDITLDAQVTSKAIELVDDNFHNPTSQDYVFVEMVLRTGVLMGLDHALKI
jgi:hypothetical protein